MLRILSVLFLIGCNGDADDTGECSVGFSGDACDWCSIESAADACHPMTIRDLFDIEATMALTLEDLDWSLDDTVHLDGVDVYVGEFSGGMFDTYDIDGQPQTLDLRSKAAIYLPEGYATSPAAGKGMVWAAHFADAIDKGVAPTIAREFGIPVLVHGERTVDWTSLGFSSRKEMYQSSVPNLDILNDCHPVDLVTGYWPWALARTDMRAITLLQRLAESQEATIDSVVLHGFSKEGHAVWDASLVDPRIEVGSPGGWHTEDRRQALPLMAEYWGCDTSTEHGTAGQGALNGLKLDLETPAGAARTHAYDIASNQDLLEPRLLLISGDVGMWDMHDGEYWAIGVETPFLEGLDTIPWRYSRKAVPGAGSANEDGDEAVNTVEPLLAAEMLVAGAGAEETLYPKVLSTEATLDGNLLSVEATTTSPAERAGVWWNHSGDMDFGEQGQDSWQSVEMTRSGDTWTAADIDVGATGVIAWYVETRNTLTISTGTEYPRIDGSPIRFLRPAEPMACEADEDLWCE